MSRVKPPTVTYVSTLTLVGLPIAVWTFASVQAFGAGVSFRTAALSGDAAPGTDPGVVFDNLNNVVPVINNAGQTAFYGILDGPGVTLDNDRGIWSEGTGTLMLVAREGQQAPGTAPGVEFANFKDPLLDDSGATAFCGFLRGAGVVLDVNHIGIWSETSGTLSLVARLGSQAPGLEPGTNFGVFNTPYFSQSGHTAFFSLLSGTGVDGTNFRSLWSEGTGTMALVTRMGSPAPGTEPGTVFENFTRPLINGAGETGFRATLSGPDVDPTNNLSFWSEGSGVLQLVAREGEPAPGTNAGVVFDDFNNISPAINDLGQLTFVAGLSGPGVDDTNDRGIWSEGSGTLALVAREGAPAPGTDPGVVFSEVLVYEIPGIPGDPFSVPGFTAQVINGAGKIAFVAGLDGAGVENDNQLGLWSDATGSLELVARMGDPAPGTAPDVSFASFGYWSANAVAMNGAGGVAFLGILTGPGVSTSNNFGIWAQSVGMLSKVIRTGDPLEVAPGDFRTVSGVDLVSGSGGQDGLPNGFNAPSQVAFGAQFTDGSSGIFVATLTGPPTGACCFGNGFCTPQTQEDCEAIEGQVYLGDGTECVGDFTCPAVCWSCQCTDGFSDSDQSAIGCVAEETACNDLCQEHGGLQSFQCDLGPCASIPTVSEWGMIVMTLLVLTAGTLVLFRARAQWGISTQGVEGGADLHPSVYDAIANPHRKEAKR